MARESMFTIIVGALVILAGVLGLVFYSSDDLGLDMNFLSFDMPTGNLLKGIFQSDSETVEFSARLVFYDYQDISFRFSEPVRMVFNYTMPNPSFYVNNIPFLSENNYVVLDGFKGDFSLTEKVFVKGKINSMYFNDVTISPFDAVPVRVENLSAGYMSISPILKKSFLLKNVQGTINISSESGSLVYEKTAGDMELRSFEGDMRVERGVIYLMGTGILKADVLKSPGI
ncbi:MAG: hypothetical protein U9P44_01310 [archaeon]|nr:hypothetical protein [archaeon]